MANMPMKAALYINENGKEEVINTTEYNPTIHNDKLFCSNGCDVKVHLRYLKKQRTKTFCANPNNLKEHSESCGFKNYYNDIYNHNFSEQLEILENNIDIFNSLKRTAIYKIKANSSKNEKKNISKYLNSTLKNEILRYIDINQIKEEDFNRQCKIFGILDKNKSLGVNKKRKGDYGYLFFETEDKDENKSIYFNENFFNNPENITSIEFDKLCQILNKNDKNNNIVVYGEIKKGKARDNEKRINIEVSDIDHIVINALHIKEILKRKGFKKSN